MPVQFLLLWLTGLVSLAVLFTGGWLVTEQLTDPVRDDAVLWTGAALLAFAFLGRPLVLRLFPKGGPVADLPEGEVETLAGAGGAALHVETVGKLDGRPVVLTHGWGMDRTIWGPVVAALADRYRVVLWDLPGLGRSRRPMDGDYSPDRFAADLDSVLAVAGRPAVLIGHSIGGMTNLSWRRLHRRDGGAGAAGLAIVDSTPVMPLETIVAGPFLKAIRGPILEPLLKLTPRIDWLARAANIASYMNGSQHLVHRVTGFGERPTRETLDHVARLTTRHSPAVMAKGLLCVMRWDASEVPARADAPLAVIVGDRDLITRPDGSRFIAEVAPDAELTVIEGAGHMGLLEYPVDYGEALRRFVDKVSDRLDLMERPRSRDSAPGSGAASSAPAPRLSEPRSFEAPAARPAAPPAGTA